MRESVFLTVYFDDPFYVGVFERTAGEQYQVSKVTFGAEPTLPEIQSYIMKYFDTLIFTEAETVTPGSRIKNPKRRKREAHKQTRLKSTRSQLAISRERERQKKVNKRERRALVEFQQRMRYEKKKQKKKEKHRGH